MNDFKDLSEFVKGYVNNNGTTYSEVYSKINEYLTEGKISNVQYNIAYDTMNGYI